jgi:hypothetical protein
MSLLLTRLAERRRRRQLRRVERLLVELDAAGFRSRRRQAVLRASIRADSL